MEGWLKHVPKLSNYKPKKLEELDPYTSQIPSSSKYVPLGHSPDTIRISTPHNSWGEFMYSLIPNGKFVPIVRHDPNLDFFKLVAGATGASGLSKFKRFCISRSNDLCEICGASTTLPELYDRWEYDEPNLTATMSRILVCCDSCYAIARLDTAQNKGKLDTASRHLAKVNGWEVVEASTYIHYALLLRSEWSDLQWVLKTPLAKIKEKFG